MKQIITLCLLLVLTISVSAQSPEKMSYQAVVRNADNTLLDSYTQYQTMWSLAGQQALLPSALRCINRCLRQKAKTGNAANREQN